LNCFFPTRNQKAERMHRAVVTFCLVVLTASSCHGKPVTFEPLPTPWAARASTQTAPPGTPEHLYSAPEIRVFITPRGGVPSGHSYPTGGIQVVVLPSWTVRHLQAYVGSITGFQSVVLLANSLYVNGEPEFHLWNPEEPLYSVFSRARMSDGAFRVTYFQAQ
jgi:hypothetical protein